MVRGVWVGGGGGGWKGRGIGGGMRVKDLEN